MNVVKSIVIVVLELIMWIGLALTAIGVVCSLVALGNGAFRIPAITFCLLAGLCFAIVGLVSAVGELTGFLDPREAE